MNDTAAHFAMVENMKSEIRADMKDGTVPATVRSFSELHDYVDANEYGVDFDAPLDIEAINAAQTAVDKWIQEGCK
jgi:hypothetical protein